MRPNRSTRPNQCRRLADIPDGATEEVGPTTSSSYPVSAVSLSDVASQLASRDEAGYCGWKEAWTYKTGLDRADQRGQGQGQDRHRDAGLDAAALDAPEDEGRMGALVSGAPRPRAGPREAGPRLFRRARRQDPRQDRAAGQALFEGAKSGLAAASKAYDAKTGNGTKTGTIIDTTIEQRELDEKKKEEDEKRKKAAAEKAGRKAEADAEGGEPAETPA